MSEGIRVLVVDDEPQLLRALRINLSARGFAVTTASTGAAALTAAAKVNPQVVVLDLGHGLQHKWHLVRNMDDAPAQWTVRPVNAQLPLQSVHGVLQLVQRRERAPRLLVAAGDGPTRLLQHVRAGFAVRPLLGDARVLRTLVAHRCLRTHTRLGTTRDQVEGRRCGALAPRPRAARAG